MGRCGEPSRTSGKESQRLRTATVLAMDEPASERWGKAGPFVVKDKVPVRIINDQKAIQDVLAGETNTTRDVAALKLFDRAGKIDLHCPLVDAIRIYLATEQAKRQKKVCGQDVLDALCGIGYGWDPNAVRVGVAALVRAGAVKVVVGQKEYSNPADRDLIDALRVARKFDKAELILEETEVPPEPPPTPPREVRPVRATDVASATRVSTAQEWEQLSRKLDQRVRQLLDEGYDVELG